MSKQNEIVKKTPLLNADGSLVNAGFCKRNLYEYNREVIAAPKWRIKEWDFYQLSNGKFMVQISFFNISIASAISACIVDLKTGERVDSMGLALGTTKRFQVPRNGDEPNNIKYTVGGVSFEFDVTKTTRTLTYSGKCKGKPVTARFSMDMLPEHESITIATPFNLKGRFFYTNKINCMPTEGEFVWGDKKWEFEKQNTFAVLDWGRGAWPHKNSWYWGNGSTRIDGKLFGFEITWGFGDESNATETAVFYDGKCHKIGAVDVEQSPRGRYMEPWHFVSDDNRFDLTMTPFFDNATGALILGLVGMRAHQVHGLWNGKVTLDDGKVLEIKDMYAFCELVDNLW